MRDLEAFVKGLDFSGGYDEKKAARDAVVERIQMLAARYGDAAATLAADFYNEIADGAGASVADAVLADTATDASVAGSVRYSAKLLFGQEPDADAFRRACAASLARFVKKAANDTVSKNAVRDGRRGAKFARVPSGSETCMFCVMLASRGFVYANRETAGEFDHFHDHCDCRVVVGFGDDAGVEGYDPDALYEKWAESDHYDYMRLRAERDKGNNYQKYLEKLSRRSDAINAGRG
ncbi:hypothetical protein [Gordonibacter massiliensis (ex Traore et al. 2017)]|uniref:VG15 protein n=1 Tax=Gordonibacter massiliensis (ex Traore et al. 2017) TaxID=1841863 RepID=UPI001C8C0504|nr:hypothetical protein [Gordonibacter massiliensis (ex Traore et al. 2017)]MBX9035039.1 hypothetical protein [Gordonibacter massiliensis (ex Traore et al. 2017)]